MSSGGFALRACESKFVTAVFWVTVAGSTAAGLYLTGKWDDGSAVLSVISFLVLVYVVFTACKSTVAQARMDREEIGNAYALIRRCRATVVMIDQALRDADLEKVRTLLDHLYGKVGLLVTQYGRYMLPEAADIVWDVEYSIVDAGFLQHGDLRQFVALMHERLDELHASVRDVDDSTLSALRNKK